MDTVRMKAPPGATECSHNAVVYKVVSGFVHVLQAAVADLQAHGYAVDAEPTVSAGDAAEAAKLEQQKAEEQAKAQADAETAEAKRLADEAAAAEEKARMDAESVKGKKGRSE